MALTLKTLDFAFYFGSRPTFDIFFILIDMSINLKKLLLCGFIKDGRTYVGKEEAGEKQDISKLLLLVLYTRKNATGLLQPVAPSGLMQV